MERDAYSVALAEDRLRTICDLRGVDVEKVVALAYDFADAKAVTIGEALERYENAVRERRI